MGKRKADNSMVFEDYFPAMIEKLGGEGFMNELCKGFEVLMDCEKRVITVESLKANCALFGRKGDVIDDEEMLQSMLSEGDLDGDGCLNLFEFCVLMFRLSPGLMNQAKSVLHPLKKSHVTPSYDDLNTFGRNNKC